MSSRTMVSVGQPMRFQAIADLLRIGKLADGIKASSVFLHRLLQEHGLLSRWLQLDAYRACCYHVHIVSYCRTQVNNTKGESTEVCTIARGTSSP